MLRCCALHSIATPNLGASPRSCGDCLCPLYICWWDGGGISGRTHPDPRSTALSNSPQRELPALLLPCCRPVAHTAHRGELSTPHTPLTADPSLNQRLNYYSSTIPLGQARPSSARCRLQVPTTGADAVSEGRGQRRTRSAKDAVSEGRGQRRTRSAKPVLEAAAGVATGATVE
jgi:hypothetical protein